MKRAGNSAGLMLEPHCAAVGAFTFIYTDHSSWPSPLVAWLLGSLFTPEHDHIANPVRAGDRLGAMKCRFFYFLGTIQMYEVASALSSHLSSAAKGRSGVYLSANGSELGVFLLFKESAGHSGGPSEYPLRGTESACFTLLIFRCRIDICEFLYCLLSYY